MLAKNRWGPDPMFGTPTFLPFRSVMRLMPSLPKPEASRVDAGHRRDRSSNIDRHDEFSRIVQAEIHFALCDGLDVPSPGSTRT